MSLASRLSAFFLAALGAVLLGFSVALYASISAYLHRQVEDRVRSSLAILAAAAEVHPDGVEWEPHERELPLGQDAGADRLWWMVHDGRGRRIDHSRNLSDADVTPDWTPGGRADPPPRLTDRRGRSWKISRRILLPGSGEATRSARLPAEPGGNLHAALILTVCAPLDPVERVLTRLGLLLVGLSFGIWTLAALLQRGICRRALAPLSRMVASARGLDADDPGWSLEPAGTGDELDELGHAFNDLLGRLRVAYERQRRFSGEASHQLRTPLTVLIGQVDVALRRDRPDEEYRRVLRLVGDRAANLAQIVEALLFLGRAEAEARTPEFVPLDLRRWVARHLADRGPHPRAPDIARDDPDDDLLSVRAHPHLLGQLLENLLDNACKYSPPGSPILVRTRRQAGHATLSVEDAGPGIAPDDLARVFEPFFRSTQSRRTGRPGVGLGLAVARRIADVLGGSIAASSEPGRGSRFVLHLPLHAEANPTHDAAPQVQ